MGDCCDVAAAVREPRCPECGRPGRRVQRVTLRSLLTPQALERLSVRQPSFCASANCGVVYFGEGDVFRREDVRVPVFQKEPQGGRTVCYCLAIREEQVLREALGSEDRRSDERIRELVAADRCACELRNPQGTCCLGNVAALRAASEPKGADRDEWASIEQ